MFIFHNTQFIRKSQFREQKYSNIYYSSACIKNFLIAIVFIIILKIIISIDNIFTCNNSVKQKKNRNILEKSIKQIITYLQISILGVPEKRF